MAAPELVRGTSHGVTLLGDPSRPGGVTLAFMERTGGVSMNAYASLNLGDACNDDPRAVRENRRRALAAIGAEGSVDKLLCPLQVHGDTVVTIASASDVAKAHEVARAGADAVVCAVSDIPVLICVADCIPMALVANGAFALVHSGWRGALARIGAKALGVLTEVASCNAGDVRVYIGPHIGAKDYQVSDDLRQSFVDEFGTQVLEGTSNLNLGAAVIQPLVSAGVDPNLIAICTDSTASNTDRFFSYRAQNGNCGRHGVMACINSNPASQAVEWQRD